MSRDVASLIPIESIEGLLVLCKSFQVLQFLSAVYPLVPVVCGWIVLMLMYHSKILIALIIPKDWTKEL